MFARYVLFSLSLSLSIPALFTYLLQCALVSCRLLFFLFNQQCRQRYVRISARLLSIGNERRYYISCAVPLVYLALFAHLAIDRSSRYAYYCVQLWMSFQIEYVYLCLCRCISQQYYCHYYYLFLFFFLFSARDAFFYCQKNDETANWFSNDCLLCGFNQFIDSYLTRCRCFAAYGNKIGPPIACAALV